MADRTERPWPPEQILSYFLLHYDALQAEISVVLACEMEVSAAPWTAFEKEHLMRIRISCRAKHPGQRHPIESMELIGLFSYPLGVSYADRNQVARILCGSS